MIIYVFNQYFPENSGFGRRCQREIEALTSIEDVTVICRQQQDQKSEEEYETINGHRVKIIRYRASSEIVHRPTDYKSNGLYEVKRNVDIMFALFFTLVKVFSDRKNRPAKLYCVTSPLTIPLLGLMLAKLMGVDPTLVSFHDLEPELAMHLKKLPEAHWLVKLEFFLERLVCHGFKKVLVTTSGQAERISKRTKTPPSKICSIENTTDISTQAEMDVKFLDKFAKKSDFVLVYMSTISFDYTMESFKDFLHYLSNVRGQVPHLKVLVIGSGEGLESLKSSIHKLKLDSTVTCLGHIANPRAVLLWGDAAIIPWQQDIMTEVMLPTKFFEYLGVGLPVFAPDFGEFKKIITNGENGFLFQSFVDVIQIIKKLMKNETLAKKVGHEGKVLYLKNYQPEVLNKKFLAFCRTS